MVRVLTLVWISMMPSSLDVSAQGRPEGNMDALLGPATLVNQGEGMTEAIRAALAPGPQHELLRRLLGEWQLREVSETGTGTSSSDVVVTELMGGAWFEMRVSTEGELGRLIHLGYDGYRGSYVMWEIGSGFTSPQVRVGAARVDAVDFWRVYTIRRRGELVRLREEVSLTFEPDGSIGWHAVEALEGQAPRVLRAARLSR